MFVHRILDNIRRILVMGQNGQLSLGDLETSLRSELSALGNEFPEALRDRISDFVPSLYEAELSHDAEYLNTADDGRYVFDRSPMFDSILNVLDEYRNGL